MKLYSSNDNYKLYQGSMLDMLEVIEPNSIDSIVTDPPYELNFMSKGWDNAGVSFQPDTWKKCYEVLKPGGYLLAFGGSRTFHRIACAIEDAGFEIRDTIMWIYGSGFPKSMNISLMLDKREGLQGQRGIGGFNVGGIQEQNNRKAKLYIGSTTDGSKQKAYTDFKGDLAKQWQGWGTALKPSFEPIIVARKPFKGSLVDNVIEYGVGGINIDECRVGNDKRTIPINSNDTKKDDSIFTELHKNIQRERVETNQGRFPANTILTYDETDYDEVCGGFPDTRGSKPHARGGTNFGIGIESDNRKNDMLSGFNDSGSASRYFYCAKASKRDRDEGLDEFEAKQKYYCDGRGNSLEIFGSTDGGRKPLKNIHPTVKPTSLMQYLVRLVSPKGSTILDCFNGSGSTGKAVMYENKERDANYKYIGIELTEEYLPIAKARIEYVCGKTEEPEVNEEIIEGQTNIFEFIGEDE